MIPLAWFSDGGFHCSSSSEWLTEYTTGVGVETGVASPVLWDTQGLAVLPISFSASTYWIMNDFFFKIQMLHVSPLSHLTGIFILQKIKCIKYLICKQIVWSINSLKILIIEKIGYKKFKWKNQDGKTFNFLKMRFKIWSYNYGTSIK